MSRRTKPVSYNKKVAEFIVSEVGKGQTVAEVCRKNKGIVPPQATISRWKKEKPRFREMMDEAYLACFEILADELDYITKNSLNTIYPETEFPEYYDSRGKLDFRAANEQRRARQNAIVTTVTKIAPILSDQFNKAAKVEHSGEVKSTPVPIVIQNYAIKNEEIAVNELKNSQLKLDKPYKLN